MIFKTEGLTRTTLPIRIGERTDLHIRWRTTLPAPGTANIGQMVRVIIPEEAVHLEAGAFRRGKQRWNRWIGRVVLVNQKEEDLVTTVKLHWESITCKSIGPVLGTRAPLSVWDMVNIVVDPQQVSWFPYGALRSSSDGLQLLEVLRHRSHFSYNTFSMLRGYHVLLDSALSISRKSKHDNTPCSTDGLVLT